MRINEQKVDAGYDAWDRARKAHTQHVVYGVVHHSKGDTVYSWSMTGALEKVVAAGMATRLCHASDDDAIALAMSQDRFAVVLGEHRRKDLLLRIYPENGELFSTKCAHPSIGGLGMFSAVVWGRD